MSTDYDQDESSSNQQQKTPNAHLPLTGTRRDGTIQDQSYQPGPIDSGTQSYNSPRQSETGSYSQPANNRDPSQADTTQPQSESAQGATNQGQDDIELRDGYKDTQGMGYDQRGSTDQAQQGYDPTHSGVRHAHNQPGERVDTPGRETGTAWGEDQQMGYSTDTPDRRNPAN
ncbi:MAG: hypothetical protein JO202_14790 [Ktedonobacteraceae bacterium]|nr:hypothetical protein [Ktedonobacteraceae bacterium]